LSPEASHIILKAPRIIVTDVVLMECVYVLSISYQKTRRQICGSLRLFIKRNNVIYDGGLADYYLGLYGSGTLDLADCYLIAYAIKNNVVLKTFDRKLQRLYETEKAKVV